MLNNEKKKMAPFIVAGIAMYFGGLLFSAINTSPIVKIVVLCLMILSVLSTIIGCFYYSKAKGHSGFWAVLGIFGLIGLLICAWMTDKNKIGSSANESNVNSGEILAWRRWSARSIDFLLGIGLFLGIIFAFSVISALLGHEVSDLDIPEGSDYFFGLLLYGFFDAVEYAIFGATLGKKICGIHVVDGSGNPIGRFDYFERDMRMCWRHIFPIFYISQCRRVKKGLPTSYDEGQEFQARATRNTRWFDGIIALIVFGIMIGLGIMGKIAG